MALQAHLQNQMSSISGGGFDNEGFNMANRLGAAALQADSSDGGDVTAVHSAGQRLADLGQGKGIVYASLGEFEGPLSTIQAWCATDSSAVAAAPAQNPAAPDDPAAGGDGTGDVSSPGPGDLAGDSEPSSDPATDPGIDASVTGGLVRALDSGCSQVNEGVLGVAGSHFVSGSESDLPVDDIPAGANATSTCTYDYSDATVSYSPLTVQFWSFDNDEDLAAMFSSIGAPDPGQAAQPGMAATATLTLDTHPAAVARKADLVVVVSEDSVQTGLSDQQLTDIAVQAMAHWRPA